MAAAAPVAPADLGTPTKGVQPLRAGQGNSFLWRRLHSLSGIIPIGAFLVEHILSNFETLNGPLAYAQQVKFLNSLPLVRVLEWAFIFIPLAFHAGYGVWISFRGRVNVNVYPWASNWMYLTQRVTGLIAFVYIIQHVIRQRFMGVQLPEHPGAAFAKVQHELSNPWMLAIYIIAMVATTWHFAYGVWLFSVKWGITPGDRARKRMGYLCGAIGTALCVMGLVSIYAVVYKYPNAPADVMPAQPPGVVAPAPISAAPIPSSDFIPTSDRRATPDFTLADVNGHPVTLSAYKGKVVLLDFWAPSCGGCKVELPWYVEFDKKYRRQGLAVIGVSMWDEGLPAIRQAMAKNQIAYTIVNGNDQVGERFHLASMPLTLLIDRGGRIAASHAGIVEKNAFEQHIQSLL